jgi:predicted nucleotidyltransferase
VITVAIICEYNPFHKGHLEQINRIRTHFAPEEVTIVALMSGNYVQRGEPAVFPKNVRVQTAILSGIDLVLELPFPYSSASAQIFADTAIQILGNMGGIDYLCFGSESGDLPYLNRVAHRLLSDTYQKSLNEKITSGKGNIPYAVARSQVYEQLYQETLPSTSNDILALEYLSSISRHHLDICPMILTRTSPYSATAARHALYHTDKDTLKFYLPENFVDQASTMNVTGFFSLDPVLIPYLLLSDPDELTKYADMTYDLASSLINHAFYVQNSEQLLQKSASKSYTNARIRRALLFSLFRVTVDQLHRLPKTVNFLGANQRGREFLRSSSENSLLSIVSRRPDSSVSESFDFVRKADLVYARLAGLSFDFYQQKPFLI